MRPRAAAKGQDDLFRARLEQIIDMGHELVGLAATIDWRVLDQKFGVKVSIATTVASSRGGQFVLAAKALPGSPYDGHTLSTVIPHIEALIGNEVKRIITDKGYRGHGMPSPYDMRVFVSEQKRGVTPAIKRELRRRSAVEPVIGHLKSDHRMGRNFLIGKEGDAANAVLAAVGYNFARMLAWLRQLCYALLASLASIILPFAGSTRHSLAQPRIN